MATRKPNKEELEGVINHDLPGLKVTIVSKHEHLNGVMLHGDGFLNKEKGLFEFIQKIGSRKANKVVKRTDHIIVREMKDNKGFKAFMTIEELNPTTFEQLASELRICINHLKKIN